MDTRPFLLIDNDPIQKMREHVRLYDGFEETPTRRDMFEGIAFAIGDWISDPRFLSGFYAGVMVVCVSALIWAFVL